MAKKIELGLKENWQQFTLLVIVNAFVGGMVGLERSIFPKFAAMEFGVESKTAILSFITAFGFSKAITNYLTGKLANRFGRRNLLIMGWLIALPIPFLLINATAWSWVVFANVLLGISQGLTWSSTVVMKIDLVGEKNRGLAMGLNEFAGYFAVGVTAFLTGLIAERYGITPYPFYLGIVIAVCGLFLTFFFIKDTQTFAQKEGAQSNLPLLKNIFWATTFKDKTLGTVTQAGLVNNLNDGMIWGLLPIVLIHLAYNTQDIGIITAIYPTVWGIGQLVTGRLSDIYSKKQMLFWGMLLQGIVILALPFGYSFSFLAILSALLGLGTALVYPTFLSTIAQATHPSQRAESLGIFRLWRDLGYAIGAIISGITADLLGIDYAIILIGALTILSAIVIQIRMPRSKVVETACIEVETVQQALFNKESIQIIDVRSHEEYEKNHIPDALHIPLQDLKNKKEQFQPNKLYVTACGTGGGRSIEAANILRDMGYQSNWLCGGTYKWLNLNI